jgi:hypothetical protein
MPVTLYAGQWERIIDMCKSGDLGTFIHDNEAILTRKEAKTEAAPVVAKSKKVAKAKKVKTSEGPTAADLAAIEAISARADRIPASDLFGDD